MRNNEVSQQKLNFVCFRCGSIIKPDDRMITMSVSLEAPTKDNSIECIESAAISSLCFPCASVLISKAVVGDEQLMMPTAMDEEIIEEEETDIKETMDCRYSKTKLDILINSVADGREADATLKVRCSEEGFYFTLQCSDGISLANSQLFTWKQIAQLAIAADPNMFGVLDEPLHQVFPQNLKLFGYYVPNWQAPPRKN